jgi:hypothetical protein
VGIATGYGLNDRARSSSPDRIKNLHFSVLSKPALGSTQSPIWWVPRSRQHGSVILIIGFCILLRVILTVNNITFCFSTIDKVFYYVASVLTTCFGPHIRPSSGEFTKY